jgi:hypothetical protein
MGGTFPGERLWFWEQRRWNSVGLVEFSHLEEDFSAQADAGGFPDRLGISRDWSIRREPDRVVGIKGDGAVEVVFRGRGGPLFVESLNCRGLGRTVIASRGRGT